jgi:hypothetical protein
MIKKCCVLMLLGVRPRDVMFVTETSVCCCFTSVFHEASDLSSI